MNTKNNIKSHWEKIYTTKSENEVSWFQDYPETSITLIENLHLPKSANIIDIGGGDSHLVDALLEKGYQNIWILDISAAAIEKSKIRLGKKALSVHWIVTDVTEFIPPVKFDLWHDRAAFHFLKDESQIEKYQKIAVAYISGYLIMGTFSNNGPNKCSGLPITKYSEEALTAQLANYFKKIRCFTVDHPTPFGTKQNFLFCIFKREN